MKILICTIVVLFYAICVNGIRVKRGLSSDEQKKLVDTLNADRQEMGKKTNKKFEILTYDATLEQARDFNEKPCSAITMGGGVPLHMNSVAKEHYAKDGNSISLSLFEREMTKIGCSKEFKCTYTVEKFYTRDEADVGKIFEFSGICRTGVLTRNLTAGERAAGISELPNPSKYGDLLGLGESSGAINFNIAVFLGILVFYF